MRNLPVYDVPFASRLSRGWFAWRWALLRPNGAMPAVRAVAPDEHRHWLAAHQYPPLLSSTRKPSALAKGLVGAMQLSSAAVSDQQPSGLRSVSAATLTLPDISVLYPQTIRAGFGTEKKSVSQPPSELPRFLLYLWQKGYWLLPDSSVFGDPRSRGEAGPLGGEEGEFNIEAKRAGLSADHCRSRSPVL